MQAGVLAQLCNVALQDYGDLIGLDFERLATEARGILVGLVMEGANRHGIILTDSPLRSMPPATEATRDAHRAADGEQHLCLNAGYDYDQVREVVTAHSYTAHIRPRGEEAQAKKAGELPSYTLFCLRPNHLVQLSFRVALVPCSHRR